jgi:hypothetical protein
MSLKVRPSSCEVGANAAVLVCDLIMATFPSRQRPRRRNCSGRPAINRNWATTNVGGQTNPAEQPTLIC